MTPKKQQELSSPKVDEEPSPTKNRHHAKAKSA
jgi:hypothetical protein